MPTRRHFLTFTLSALTLFAAPGLRAELLSEGRRALHGQRGRALWLAVNRLAGVRIAQPGDLIQAVVFVDLNCPACAQFWHWFDTPERRKWATLWIPVAYMNPTSAGRAAALLRAADPYAALAHNYGSGFDHESRSGALPAAPAPSLQEQSAIRANTRFWKHSLFGATPLTVYRNQDGSYVQLTGLFPEPDMSGYFSQLAPARLESFRPR